MNVKLPTFAFILCVLLMAAGVLAQVDSRQSDAPLKEGDQLVEKALQNLLNLSPFRAKLTQRVDLFGQELVGAGSYLQAGQGIEKLIRMELKMNVGGQLLSVQQISNQRFFWIRRELAGESTLARVDLQRIRDAVAAADSLPRQGLVDNWVVLGGIPRLLSALLHNCNFKRPLEQEMKAGDALMKVWVVEGEWSRAARQGFVARGGATSAEIAVEENQLVLPEYLPQRVRLVLGRDERLPLFPYRIEFLAAKSDRLQGNTATAVQARLQSMVTLEMFNVTRADDIDRAAFEYQPGDQVVDHQTEFYLKRLGLTEDGF